MPRKLSLLLPLAALIAGCAARPRLVRHDSIDRLDEVASRDLGCAPDELQSVPLTLFTRAVSGCDKQAVYAYDWMWDAWVLDESLGAGDGLPGERSAGRSSGDEFLGPQH